jgi:hypothetical protein
VPLETDGQCTGQLEIHGIGQYTPRRDIHRMPREEAHALAQQVAQSVALDAAEQGMQVPGDPLRAHHRAERILQRNRGRAADEDGAAHRDRQRRR